MALNPKRTSSAANAAVDAMAALLNGGKLRIYSGSQPASADDGIGGATLLAELTFGSPAFGAGVAGVATANAITGDATADATGTAAWFRALQSNGSTVVYDGTVGAGGSFDCVLNTVAIQAGATVNITALTLTESKG